MSGPSVETIESISRDTVGWIIEVAEESGHLIGGGRFIGSHLGDPEFRDLVLGLQFLVGLDGGLEGFEVGGLAVVMESEDVEVAAVAVDAGVEEVGHVVHTHAGVVQVVGCGGRDELRA